MNSARGQPGTDEHQPDRKPHIQGRYSLVAVRSLDEPKPGRLERAPARPGEQRSGDHDRPQDQDEERPGLRERIEQEADRIRAMIPDR